MPFLCGSCVTGVAWLLRSVVRMQRKHATQDKSVNDGLIALLAAALMDIYYQCSVRGHTTQEDRHNASRAYKAYHGLGANGEITDIYNKIIAMPIREDG